MPSNLLLLPLLAGFWFVSRAHYFRFRVQRLDGYWLLLESSFFGVIFAAVARITVVVTRNFPAGAQLAALWSDFSPVPYTGTMFGSLCVGLIAPYLLNGLFSFFGGVEAARNLAIERHGTDLDRLLNAAITHQRKISLTLNNRKWYVGSVSRAPNLSPNGSHVSILPIMSGFRNSETLETEATTDYVPIYETGVDRNAFAVIVPLSAITSAGFFDDAIYVQFNGQRQKDVTEKDVTESDESPTGRD